MVRKSKKQENLRNVSNFSLMLFILIAIIGLFMAFFTDKVNVGINFSLTSLIPLIIFVIIRKMEL